MATEQATPFGEPALQRPPTMTTDQLLSILRPFGQEHLLAFWDKLDGAAQESLARQIEAIDFGLVRRLFDGRNQQGNAA